MFREADPIVSPAHIVPEWYFLFAYAILRCIPNKTLGVLALWFSIFVFFLFIFIDNYVSPLGNLNKWLVFTFIVNRVLLSWLGHCPVEEPYVFCTQVVSFIYFFLIFLMLFVYYGSGKLFVYIYSI